MKARLLAGFIAASALAFGAAAQVDQEDPLTRQLNRWGVPATPENIARYHAEHGTWAPYYLPHQYQSLGPGYVLHNGVPVYLGTPPVGYQWQNYGNDYALINQITGVIAQILRVR